MKKIILSSFLSSIFVANANAIDVKHCQEVINDGIEVFNGTIGKACHKMNEKLRRANKPYCEVGCMSDFASSIEGPELKVDVEVSANQIDVNVSKNTFTQSGDADSDELYTAEDKDETSLTSTTDVKLSLSLGLTIQLSPDYSVSCVNPLIEPAFERLRTAILDVAKDECLGKVNEEKSEESNE